MRGDPSAYVEHGETCYHSGVANPYHPVTQEKAYKLFEQGWKQEETMTFLKLTSLPVSQPPQDDFTRLMFGKANLI